MKAISFIISLLVSTTALSAQSIIKLQPEQDGKYTVDAALNGVGVRTWYVSESWFSSVSATTYTFLYENGYIKDSDIKGMTVVKMPDGKTVKAGSFVIRSLKMGNVIVKDLPAFVIKSQSVPLLIGNSAFDCFGTVTVDGDKLIIDDDGASTDIAENAMIPQSGTITPGDSLKIAAMTHINAGRYEKAAEAFEKIATTEPLNAYYGQQYIATINALHRSQEVITCSKEWLSAYKGQSPVMDYVIYDAMGDSYARDSKTDAAIEAYQTAVSVYCNMFGTDESGIMKSKFRDETLGVTLYDLSRQYAIKKNLKKAEYYCALAAKCGNAAAIEFCKRYKIKVAL